MLGLVRQQCPGLHRAYFKTKQVIPTSQNLRGHFGQDVMITSPNALLSDMERQAVTGPSHISGAESGLKGRQAPLCISLHLSSTTLLPNVHPQLPEVVVLQGRREGHAVLGEEEMELGVILSEAVREDLTGKRTFEQRSERSDRLSHTGSWEDKLLGGISTGPTWGGSNQRRSASAATERRGDRCVGGTAAAGALLKPHCLQSSHPAPLYPRPLVLSRSTSTRQSKHGTPKPTPGTKKASAHSPHLLTPLMELIHSIHILLEKSRLTKPVLLFSLEEILAFYKGKE